MKLKKTVYIVDAKRIATGKFLGSLSKYQAFKLPKPIIDCFTRNYSFIKNSTDELIIGNVLSCGIGMNLSRIIGYQNGLSFKTTAITINYVCGSGLRAIIEASKSIALNQAHVIIAGGVESMSNAPHYIPGIRQGMKFGNFKIIDSIYSDGLYCSLSNRLMGETAEYIAKKYKINRDSQDVYAYQSHKKALKAIANKSFFKEIVSFPLETSEFAIDEQPRTDTSIEKLSKLKPIFSKSGTITAGNSSSLNDGAALLIIMSELAVRKYRIEPIARIVDYNYIAIKPETMGLAPYYSIKKLLKNNKISVDSIDLFEINEAFSSQILAVLKLLQLNPKKVNVNGGAIALGHPLGATGAVLLTKLIYALEKNKKKYGIVSLCIGGGQGISILIEKL